MSRAALIASVIIACSSDPRDREYDDAMTELDENSAGTLVRLCCPYPFTPEGAKPSYLPACISLDAELLAWRNQAFTTRAVSSREMWTPVCRAHVPAETLILGLLRTDDLDVRRSLVKKLAEYAPTPRIIAALLRELTRSGSDIFGDAGASVQLARLAETDLELVVDALANPAATERKRVLLVLDLATEQRLEMPRLEERLRLVASRDPDDEIRRYAANVLERYREQRRIPIEDAIAHLRERPHAELPLIGRRRIGCGSVEIEKLLQEAAADPWKYGEQQEALQVLEHRSRYCRGYENLGNPNPVRPKPSP
jgi:hypothetical protein